MGRRRKDEPNFIDELFELLLIVPIWAGPIIAFAFFAGLRWLIPWALPGESDPDGTFAKTFWTTLANFSVLTAPWAGGAAMLVWIAAEVRKLLDRNRLDKQTGIDSIRDLGWREFELLLSEAWRRQGYLVEHFGGAGPDGGIDQRLAKSGEITLAQCKHWRSQKVGVKVVRELLGVMTSEGATAGIVVTSGVFTADATEFARNNRLTLIDGHKLEQLIREVQGKSPQPTPVSSGNARVEPACPKCGSSMTMRTAKRGSNAGSQFWGCTRYPECRGTRDQV